MQRREVAIVPLAILFSVLTGLGITAAPAVTLSLAAAAVMVIFILMSESALVDHLILIALLSGPPRIRARDPLASLQGQTDWVVVLHVIVWLAGAVWVFRELFKNRSTAETESRILRWPHYAGLLLVVLLGLSMAVSPESSRSWS